MMHMEFMDADYSVLLDYAEQNPETTDEKMTKNERPAAQTKQDSARPVEDAARWSFSYCQQFFDVKTTEVLARMAKPFGALKSTEVLTEDLLNKPDLYGPIWICVTLALELGLTSDLSHYFEFSTERLWRSSVNTVYRASVMLFLYSWCLPAVIWIALEWNVISEVKYKLVDLLSVYGYANAVFLPVFALWTAPVPWLRWVSCLLAAFFSGLAICRSLKKAFVKLEPCRYYTIQILLFILNLLIAICFNVFFFHSHHHAATALHNATLHHNQSINTTASPIQITINREITQFNHLNNTNSSMLI